MELYEHWLSRPSSVHQVYLHHLSSTLVPLVRVMLAPDVATTSSAGINPNYHVLNSIQGPDASGAPNL